MFIYIFVTSIVDICISVASLISVTYIHINYAVIKMYIHIYISVNTIINKYTVIDLNRHTLIANALI